MRHVLKLFVALALGMLTGWLSVKLSENSHLLAGHLQVGAWQVWPAAGRSGVLPHVRLPYQGHGQLPPSPQEQLELVAMHDDKGRRLKANCHYLLSGKMPEVRLWMLSVEADGDRQKASFLMSTDAIAQADGTLQIHLDHDLQPGNWLKLPREGTFMLVLRLFGSSPLARDKMLASPPFAIRREECR